MGGEYEMCRCRMGNGRPDPVFPCIPLPMLRGVAGKPAALHRIAIFSVSNRVNPDLIK